jgi:hypothetical protein
MGGPQVKKKKFIEGRAKKESVTQPLWLQQD